MSVKRKYPYPCTGFEATKSKLISLPSQPLQKTISSSFEPRVRGSREPRILGRRYPLTKDFSKYLEIGVTVGCGDGCYVELVIGDNRGHEIPIAMDVWRDLMLRSDDIMEMFTVPTETTEIGDHSSLLVRTVKLNNIETMNIFNETASIYVTANTMRKIFDLEYCIDHMYSWLEENIPSIKYKLATFVDVIRATTTQNYREAIMKDSSYERHSLIDCELLALCMKTILGEAMMVRSMNSTGNNWEY